MTSESEVRKRMIGPVENKYRILDPSRTAGCKTLYPGQ